MAEATEFERVGNITHRMADDLAKSDKAARGVESAFSGLFKQLVGAEVVGGAIREMVRNSRVVLALQQSLSGENLSRVRLTQREIQLTSELNFQERMRRLTSGHAHDMASAHVDELRHQLDLLQKQKVVASELASLSKLEIGYMGLMVTAGTTMWLNARQFNQNLIEANSSWQHRDRLIRQTLLTSTQLGISFDDVTRSAAALVHYGMDTADTFETNLRLVSQMEQGLGVSVNESARLASIVERQLKGSFESVSHVIAQIVDDTALAGDEAARLATNISTALGRLRPGMSAATLPEVVRLVGRYESALKEVGGQSGAFQQLLTQLTTPEGLVGAGALGVNPEFLATSQGVQNVMDRFANYGEMLVGQSQGWERQMRLQALAQVFNTTADNANQMLIAIKRANETQMGQISTQERWRQQLSATNSGITRLGNSLLSLLQGAMYPVIFVVGAIANKLADFVESVLKYKEVVYALGIALGVGAVIVTMRMWALARALWAVAASSTLAQVALNRQAAANTVNTAAQYFGRFTPMSAADVFRANLTTFRSMSTGATTFGGRMAGWFPTFTSGWSALVTGIRSIGPAVMGVLRGVTLVGAGMTALIGIVAAIAAWKLWQVGKTLLEIKKLNEENLAAQKVIKFDEDKLRAQRERKMYAEARYSDDPMVGLMKQYEGRLQDIVAQDTTWQEKRKQIAAAQAQLEEDVSVARVTRNLFTPLVERSPEEQKADADLRDMNGKVLGVNEKMEKHMIQRIQQERDRIDEERLEKAKDRVLNPMRYFVPNAR